MQTPRGESPGAFFLEVPDGLQERRLQRPENLNSPSSDLRHLKSRHQKFKSNLNTCKSRHQKFKSDLNSPSSNLNSLKFEQQTLKSDLNSPGSNLNSVKSDLSEFKSTHQRSACTNRLPSVISGTAMPRASIQSRTASPVAWGQGRSCSGRTRRYSASSSLRRISPRACTW